MIYKFIGIEGNIGAGKTTLANLLSEEFNGQLILEAFEDNPYLPKFYENNSKYALQVEISFLIVGSFSSPTSSFGSFLA